MYSKKRNSGSSIPETGDKKLKSAAKLGKEKAARRFYLPLPHDSARIYGIVVSELRQLRWRAKQREPV
ncbi:MAG: hypothetical protein IPJ82_21980 [Lewinellaceae bacterium]|nr:hypothetical protein [Lewinellaceae bacterium]